MAISGICILPPMAIARFGSSPTPLEAFDLVDAEEDPLGFRRICPRPTFEVDPASGAISREYLPERIRFKDGDRIRPVAPFLEVFARTSPDSWEPVTLDLLATLNLRPADISWTVEVANLKVFRQTGRPEDQVHARLKSFSDHELHELRGECVNFLEGKYIPFGTVRYIRPTDEHPEIRLRFTPAAGRVYGSSPSRLDVTTGKEITDPVFEHDTSRIVYDTTRGGWRGFQADPNSKTLPNPSDIYQGYWPDSEPLPISWGYLDDVCDGRVSVRLTLDDGSSFEARAWISACMPAFAPDSRPMRTVADEIEQLISGPEIAGDEISIDEAAEIVRRGLETIRLMNTQAMNGNVIDGRANVASTLGRQDSNDHGRYFAPIMAASLVDPQAVRTLHERIVAALKSGSAPWFSEVLRKPEEIGDLSDKGRRKMPPMLRGADSRALTLTRRQIDKIVKAATSGLFRGSSGDSSR